MRQIPKRSYVVKTALRRTKGNQLLSSRVSDRGYDGFVDPALSAIIDAQIKTGVLRFDTGQYQRPAAFGAGGPKVVDKLKIKRVYHGTDQPAPLRSK